MLKFNALRGSYQRAVHPDAPLPLRPILATIVLSLTLVGLAAKAITPGIADDDVACKVLDDSGNATIDDTDDDGKPAPDIDSAKCKCSELAKAILVTLDTLLPHTLMPVHGLAVCDEIGRAHV